MKHFRANKGRLTTKSVVLNKIWIFFFFSHFCLENHCWRTNIMTVKTKHFSYKKYPKNKSTKDICLNFSFIKLHLLAAIKLTLLNDFGGIYRHMWTFTINCFGCCYCCCIKLINKFHEIILTASQDRMSHKARCTTSGHVKRETCSRRYNFRV